MQNNTQNAILKHVPQNGNSVYLITQNLDTSCSVRYLVQTESRDLIYAKANKTGEKISEWEPRVSRISEWDMIEFRQEQISAEEFTAQILRAIFYRGYGDYYFKQRFIDLEKASSEEEYLV
jgi:hypothetical protein